MHRVLYIFFLACVLTACTANKIQTYDALVSQNPTPEQTKVFSQIQAALDNAPANNKKPYRIFIGPGDYYEKLTISKNNIVLIGAGAQQTRIYYDAYAGQVRPTPMAEQSIAGGQPPVQANTWGTSGSATVTIDATDVQLHQLTIENSFDFLANDALAQDHPARIAHSQAVALFIAGNSDRTLARQVQLLGYQDTLYVNAGRSWFDKSLIAGNIDFIFGRGNALFTDSELRSLARADNKVLQGYLVAPSTDISDEFGFTFIHCTLTRADSIPAQSVALGRPWHPTTQFPDGRYADPNAIGKAVFINSWMDAHITTHGWEPMSGSAKDGSRTLFQPADARFFEYGSHGPGAHSSPGRRQLQEEQIHRYQRHIILGDWQLN